jgi:hypothetical protein
LKSILQIAIVSAASVSTMRSAVIGGLMACRAATEADIAFFAEHGRMVVEDAIERSEPSMPARDAVVALVAGRGTATPASA